MTLEVFTWERAKYIYQNSKSKDPSLDVWEWLTKKCECDNTRAIDIATSPKLKNHEQISDNTEITFNTTTSKS